MIKKLKCFYPGCIKGRVHNHQLILINKKDSNVNLPFCEYHYFIVIGGHFKAKIIIAEQNLLGEKKEQHFELIGPLQEVEISEQVLGAREMIVQFKSNNKNK